MCLADGNGARGTDMRTDGAKKEREMNEGREEVGESIIFFVVLRSLLCQSPGGFGVSGVG